MRLHWAISIVVACTLLAGNVNRADAGFIHRSTFAASGDNRSSRFTLTTEPASLLKPAGNTALPLLENIAALATGAQHTCALTSAGKVLCWGDNRFGQLGDATPYSHSRPMYVVGLHGSAEAISVSQWYSCAAMAEGGVVCWGLHFSWKYYPVPVPGLTSRVKSIVTGFDHACVLNLDGGVKCWGSNGYGQLGDGTTTNRDAPVDVATLSSGVVAITASGNHTCALTSTGGTKCWGDNEFGQLGDGTTTHRSLPVDVIGLSSGVAAVDAGGWHTCALITGGGVKCWGINDGGQLGDGTLARSSSPVDVIDLAGNAQAISAGDVHTCALMESGGVRCWGDNRAGQLGDGTKTNRGVPGDVLQLSSGITAISAGSWHSCAITTAGKIKCWGSNYSGQLGDGIEQFRLLPTDVKDLPGNVAMLTTGGGHTCAPMTVGGVKCWGYNGSGGLGDGTRTNRGTPVDVIGLPSDVTAIYAGAWHTCALTAAGEAWCWGDNEFGQLGDGTTDDRLVPIKISGLPSSLASITPGYYHTCAVTTAGAAFCWGANGSYQLGDGTPIQRLLPVGVAGLSSGVKSISLGYYFTCALTIGSGVKCWGANGSGAAGTGTTDIVIIQPTDVIGLTSSAEALVSTGASACALKTGGGVKCWGENSYGRLGDGGTANRRTPVDVVGLSGGTASITAGSAHVCVRMTGGGSRCWGANNIGQLGDGTLVDRNIPVPVIALPGDITGIFGGGTHTCALKPDGEVMCWGNDSAGQLGQGTTLYWLTPVDVLAARERTMNYLAAVRR